MSDSVHGAEARRRVLDALAEMEAALRAFEEAYLAWAQAEDLQRPLRKGLLAQAETRLSAAREALEALEASLADARGPDP